MPGWHHNLPSFYSSSGKARGWWHHHYEFSALGRFSEGWHTQVIFYNRLECLTLSLLTSVKNILKPYSAPQYRRPHIQIQEKRLTLTSEVNVTNSIPTNLDSWPHQFNWEIFTQTNFSDLEKSWKWFSLHKLDFHLTQIFPPPLICKNLHDLITPERFFMKKLIL